MKALDFEGTVDVIQKQVFSLLMSGTPFAKICNHVVQLTVQAYARENAMHSRGPVDPNMTDQDRRKLVADEYAALERDVSEHMLDNMLGTRKDGKGPQSLSKVVEEVVQIIVDRYLELAKRDALR